MQVDLLFFVFILLGLGSQLFYDPNKVRTYILGKLTHTPFGKLNKAQQMGLELLLIVPTYLSYFLKFGIMGWIFFKAYDLIGMDKTVIILLILVYINLTDTKKPTKE
jgi:hypothetical protein